MKGSLSTRLAVHNLRHNAKLYIHGILTGVGLTAVFTIMLALAQDERLAELRGGYCLPEIMRLGVIVIGLLSLILVLYTGSFQMKRRSLEFGLYNVLGLEKRHIGRILLKETLIELLAILAGGLGTGVLLYKLCAIIICRLLGYESVLTGLHISSGTLVFPALFFTALYLFSWVIGRIRIAVLNPRELMSSAHAGEKEPRVSWLLLVLGLASLGGGYSISILTKSPLDSILLFFVAVILVIIGTYALFLAGSTALLKLLKRRKNYYYNKKHMIPVSGLLYRMKQNAVGLASIAILATMVLVMVSTTVSTYAKTDSTIKERYPHQVYWMIENDSGTVPGDALMDAARAYAEEQGLEISCLQAQTYLEELFVLESGSFLPYSPGDDSGLVECLFITEGEYRRLTGESLSLNEGEAAYYHSARILDELPERVSFGENGLTLTQPLEGYPIRMIDTELIDIIGFVLPDEETLSCIDRFDRNAYELSHSNIQTIFAMDFADEAAAEEADATFCGGFIQAMGDIVDSEHADYLGYSYDSKWSLKEELNGMFGSLLFLGILLSIVFLLATALIIYYKQISEGYDDRERFAILQKVGLSQAEVKGAIRRQVLLVFFLPLVTAAVHMAFAIPILLRMLKVLYQSDPTLFLWCTAGTLGVFALIYTLIYGATARSYYQIVKI